MISYFLRLFKINKNDILFVEMNFRRIIFLLCILKGGDWFVGESRKFLAVGLVYGESVFCFCCCLWYVDKGCWGIFVTVGFRMLFLIGFMVILFELEIIIWVLFLKFVYGYVGDFWRGVFSEVLVSVGELVFLGKSFGVKRIVFFWCKCCYYGRFLVIVLLMWNWEEMRMFGFYKLSRCVVSLGY